MQYTFSKIHATLSLHNVWKHKEMYKVSEHTCRTIVLLIKPFVQWRSCCRRYRGLLKLPVFIWRGKVSQEEALEIFWGLALGRFKILDSHKLPCIFFLGVSKNLCQYFDLFLVGRQSNDLIYGGVQCMNNKRMAQTGQLTKLLLIVAYLSLIFTPWSFKFISSWTVHDCIQAYKFDGPCSLLPK